MPITHFVKQHEYIAAVDEAKLYDQSDYSSQSRIPSRSIFVFDWNVLRLITYVDKREEKETVKKRCSSLPKSSKSSKSTYIKCEFGKDRSDDYEVDWNSNGAEGMKELKLVKKLYWSIIFQELSSGRAASKKWPHIGENCKEDRAYGCTGEVDCVQAVGSPILFLFSPGFNTAWNFNENCKERTMRLYNHFMKDLIKVAFAHWV